MRRSFIRLFVSFIAAATFLAMAPLSANASDGFYDAPGSAIGQLAMEAVARRSRGTA